MEEYPYETQMLHLVKVNEKSMDILQRLSGVNSLKMNLAAFIKGGKSD